MNNFINKIIKLLKIDKNKFPNDLFEWNFNVYKINDINILQNIVEILFNKTFDLHKLNIKACKLSLFIKEISKYYNNNHFHNFQHAISVLQFTYMLIHNTSIKDVLTKNKLFAIFISSFVHDVDHPGHTNSFEINSKSLLSFKYNEKSVLENHHCTTTFYLMDLPHIKLLDQLSDEAYHEIRETIIECVISTDMLYHSDMVNELKTKNIYGWNFSSKEDQLFLSKIIVHSADLSNTVKLFNISKKVSIKLSKEYIDQVILEDKLLLPVLDYMRCSDNIVFYKNEILFCKFIAHPLWNEIVITYPQLKNLTKQLDINIKEWNKLFNEL